MRARRGFTLVEMMVVVALIGILTSIAIPNFIQAQQAASKNACISNLTQLDAALQMYFIDNDPITNPATNLTTNLEAYIMKPEKMKCPLDNSTYIFNTGGSTAPATATCPNTGLGHNLD